MARIEQDRPTRPLTTEEDASAKALLDELEEPSSVLKHPSLAARLKLRDWKNNYPGLGLDWRRALRFGVVAGLAAMAVMFIANMAYTIPAGSGEVENETVVSAPVSSPTTITTTAIEVELIPPVTITAPTPETVVEPVAEPVGPGETVEVQPALQPAPSRPDPRIRQDLLQDPVPVGNYTAPELEPEAAEEPVPRPLLTPAGIWLQVDTTAPLERNWWQSLLAVGTAYSPPPTTTILGRVKLETKVDLVTSSEGTWLAEAVVPLAVSVEVDSWPQRLAVAQTEVLSQLKDEACAQTAQLMALVAEQQIAADAVGIELLWFTHLGERLGSDLTTDTLSLYCRAG